MIGFRHTDPRYPLFLWEEGRSQPAGRWHAAGDGPAHYFSDTADGARDGKVIVLYGPQPNLTGWMATAAGRPGKELLPCVRHF